MLNESYLLKPHIDPLDINTQRIRRNLNILSIVILLYVFGASEIVTSEFKFVGLTFKEMNLKVIVSALLVTLFYFWSHFLWACWNNFKENKLRLTGVKPAVATSGTYMGGHAIEANTNDKRQTSILSWWSLEKERHESYQRQLKKLEEETVPQAAAADVKNALDEISRYLEAAENRQEYLELAFQRFENWYGSYSKSQSIRWILFDFGMPLLFGAAAFVSAICEYIN
mgnify:CR=1 FL=1